MKKRTRDGCWTCRKRYLIHTHPEDSSRLKIGRKKKCDGSGMPCGNCVCLGLECENRIKLVWEDDARRVGMKRRGPTSNTKKITPSQTQKQPVDSSAQADPSYDYIQLHAANSDATDKQTPDFGTPSNPVIQGQMIRYRQLSAYPRVLDAADSLLLDHYIQRFSREYPTCSEPSNPFLSVLIPIAMQCSMVLDSLLALSGAQRWSHGIVSMEKESLRLRQRALRGAREILVTDSPNELGNTSLSKLEKAAVKNRTASTSQQNLLYLLTSSVLFLLYEKVSGETTWQPHMEFIKQFFETWMTSLAIYPNQSSGVSEAIRFLHDIFVYNDLVRSTSLRTRPLSAFYLTGSVVNGPSPSSPANTLFSSRDADQAQSRRRYYFPNLIARLSSDDHSVSEEDIASWDGSMDWLPSFALDRSEPNEKVSNDNLEGRPRSCGDRTIISELYRTAAHMYRRQSMGPRFANEFQNNDQVLPQLASFAHFLLTSLPEGSSYENALLWPLGIAAKELTTNQSAERSDVILRLQSLERRFQMRHFSRVQDLLLRHWARRDGIADYTDIGVEQDTILLG